MTWSWSLDGPVLLLGCICAIACAIPGTLLVVRRMGMMSEAIAHASLPGIVIAALLMRSADLSAMLVGALVVGVLTTVSIQWLQRLSQLDAGTTMGVVFTSLFALGLLLISRHAHGLRLDPHIILFGNLNLAPFGATTTLPLIGTLPTATATLAILALVNAAVVTVFSKEILVTSFDPTHARLQGIAASAFGHGMIVLATITTIAAFEAVGAIMVVSMMTVPAMTATRLCSRLWTTMIVACLIGCLGVVLGHIAALTVPPILGPLLAGEHGHAIEDTSTAGAITVTYGALFTLAVLFSPRDGLIVDMLRRRSLSVESGH